MASSRRLGIARAFAGALCASLAVLGCGGASDSGLFSASPGDSTAVDASTPNGASDAASTPMSSHDAGGPLAQDASSNNPPPPGSDSGGNPPPPVDSGPSDPGIKCGSTYCNPSTSVCCRVPSQSGPGNADSCMSQSDCDNAQGLSIPCDDSADCQSVRSGDVCCVTEDNNGLASQIQCSRPSQCNDPSSQTTLCAPSVDTCPNGGSCAPSQQTITGYTICHP
jgi:hypothetical protein